MYDFISRQKKDTLHLQLCVSTLRHTALYLFNQKYVPILFCILSHSTVIHSPYTVNTFIKRRKKVDLCKPIITPIQSKNTDLKYCHGGG